MKISFCAVELERHVHESEQVEAAGLQVQVDERDQHQHGTEERVEEELEGRVDRAARRPRHR